MSNVLLFFQGLLGTKNFYLETDPGVTVGVWQILPDSQVEESDGISEESDWWDRQLNDGRWMDRSRWWKLGSHIL